MKRLLIGGWLILLIFSCEERKKTVKKNAEQPKAGAVKTTFLTISKPQNEVMEAVKSGTLILDNGCLKIGEHTIIWPYGFKLGKNNKAIYNPEGNIVVEIGNKILISGGECAACSDEHIRKITGAVHDSNCDGKHWIVGDSIELIK